MEIDWVVAIGVFLIFVAWGFAFYFQITSVRPESPGAALETVSERVLGNISVRVHSVPIIANVSNVSVSGKVLFFEYRWPFGKNSSKIYKGSIPQICNITNNTVYWRSDIVAWNNRFRLAYSEQNASLNCTGGFEVVNESRAVPFSIEESSRISRARLSGMNRTNYSVFKSFLGISRDFNITIENSSATVLSYGLQPPRQTDVFAKRILGIMEETGENLTITFLTW